MVKILIIFLRILTLTSGRRNVKTAPLWLENFKETSSPNWNQDVGPLAKSETPISVLDEEDLHIVDMDAGDLTVEVFKADDFNIANPTKRELEMNDNEEAELTIVNNDNILRICTVKGCAQKGKYNDNDSNKKSQNTVVKAKFTKVLIAIENLLETKKEHLDTTSDKICSQDEGRTRNGKKCDPLRMRSKEEKKRGRNCACGILDLTCKLECERHADRCGCQHNDYICLNKCFEKEMAGNDSAEQSQILINDSMQCNCSETDNICQEKCFQHENSTNKNDFLQCNCSNNNPICQERCLNNNTLALRSFLRCGCGKTDRMCQDRCFDGNNFALRSYLQCDCGKTDRMCQDRCVNRDDLVLRSFLGCGCGKTDRVCQDRCFNGDDSGLRNFLRCGCGKTDRVCQDRCFNRDDSALRRFFRCGCSKNDIICHEKCLNANDTVLQSFLICGCGKNNRICQTKCLNSDEISKKMSAIQSNLRCGCRKTDRNCQNRCFSHDHFVSRRYFKCGCQKMDLVCKEKCLNEDDSVLRSFLLCGCGEHDVPCQKECLNPDGSLKRIWPTRSDLRCGCNVTDFSCLDRCARNAIKETDSDISNCGCSFNDYACKVKCDGTYSGWKKPNNRKCKCKKYDYVCKDRCARYNKGRLEKKDSFHGILSQVPSKIFKLNNNIDVAVYDPLKVAHVLDGIQFNENINYQKQFLLNDIIDNNERINKLSYPMAKDNSNKGKNKGKIQKIDNVLRELQDAKMIEFDTGSVQTEPNGNLQSSVLDSDQNENRDGGMEFANDIVKTLQDYLIARRKSKNKQKTEGDKRSRFSHQKHSFLPQTKRQKMKKMHGQAGRSHGFIKFRRNVAVDKAAVYGAPFELDLKGMGQVNFEEAVKLLNA